MKNTKFQFLSIVGLVVVASLFGLYVLIKDNRDYFRNKLYQSQAGSFLLDIYHNAGFMPIEVNRVSYSIFDSNPTWEVEDAKERAKLPEFRLIPGLDVDEALRNEPSIEFKSWERSHGNAYSNKYSELNQINISNVANLVPAWVYHSGENEWSGNVETNPIIVDGKIFVTTPADYLVSINATTGVENWRIKIRAPARRGLLWWGGNAKDAPRLFVPSSDGVYAVNPADGKIIKNFGRNGRVGDAASLVAPIVDGSRLIVATIAPSIEAYEVVSGKPLWNTSLLKSRVAPIGRDFRLGGGVPWAGFSLDSARSRIYVSTGNPRPSLYGPPRPGRNEFTSSVVSIDSVTGEIKWAFQEVAHDLWDFDVPSPPVLATIQRQGKRIDVVVAVTKIGNTLLLERDSGKPVFDYRLRRAPVSRVPGESTWPYQPAVEMPEPFMKQVFEASDITNIGKTERSTVERKLKQAEFGFFTPPAIHKEVATFGLHGGAEWPGAAIDPSTGILYVPVNHAPWIIRLIYHDRSANSISSFDPTGEALYQDRCGSCHGREREGYYEKEFTGDRSIPSLVGITASRGLALIEQFQKHHLGNEPSSDLSEDDLNIIYRYLNKADHISDRRKSLEIVYKWQQLLDNSGYPGSKPPWGSIASIDLNSGKKLWQVPFGEYQELTFRGINNAGQPNYGGLIVTKGGLIFATGTIDKKIRAYDATNGGQLWDYELPAAGSAPPSTYEINGIQYLIVVATGGIFAGFKERSDTIMAFRLGKMSTESEMTLPR